jgi:hypothetical protein
VKIELSSPATLGWLSQIEGNDRNVAEQLLSALLVVTADDFQKGLTDLVDSRVAAGAGPIGLYAECPVRTWKGASNRLFPEKGRVRRAHGVSINRVFAQNPAAPEIGSEGIVGSLITQLFRSNPRQLLSHPGADLIRANQVRRFVLVTDFVGSGDRALHYLDAAWRVASIKSWVSGGFLSFEVACYSGLPEGIARVRAHPSAPQVFQVAGCPTVGDLDRYSNSAFSALIARNGPKDSETKIPRLGYRNGGALIAFAHGIPNNAPRFLFKKGRRWKPLFAGQVARMHEVATLASRQERLSVSLRSLRENKLARNAAVRDQNPNDYLMALILVSLKRKPRRIDVVSARTGLSVAECASIIERITKVGWLDANLRLTPKAFLELDYLRAAPRRKLSLTFPKRPAYVPTQLRAPEELR